MVISVILVGGLYFPPLGGPYLGNSTVSPSFPCGVLEGHLVGYFTPEQIVSGINAPMNTNDTKFLGKWHYCWAR